MERRTDNGFTIVELIIAITIAAIIAVMATPSMKSFIDTSRLRAAAEAIAGDLQLARSEAVKRNARTFVNFKADGTTTWCYGLNANQDSPGCNCDLVNLDNTATCTLLVSNSKVLFASTTKKTVTPNLSSDYSGIQLSQPSFNGKTYTTFSPTRGTAGAGSLTLTAANNRVLKVIISAIGRVRICTPAANSQRVNGYTACQP